MLVDITIPTIIVGGWSQSRGLGVSCQKCCVSDKSWGNYWITQAHQKSAFLCFVITCSRTVEHQAQLSTRKCHILFRCTFTFDIQTSPNKKKELMFIIRHRDPYNNRGKMSSIAWIWSFLSKFSKAKSKRVACFRQKPRMTSNQWITRAHRKSAFLHLGFTRSGTVQHQARLSAGEHRVLFRCVVHARHIQTLPNKKIETRVLLLDIAILTIIAGRWRSNRVAPQFLAEIFESEILKAWRV